jgi:hypothetical protein
MAGPAADAGAGDEIHATPDMQSAAARIFNVMN